MARLLYLIKWNWSERRQYQCPCSPNTWYVLRKGNACLWCKKEVKVRSKFWASLWEALTT